MAELRPAYLPKFQQQKYDLLAYLRSNIGIVVTKAACRMIDRKSTTPFHSYTLL